MQSNLKIGAMCGAAIVVFLGGVIALPWAQSAETKVDRLVSEQVEKARRVLHRYHAGADMQDQRRRQLERLGLSFSLAKIPDSFKEDAGVYQSSYKAAWESSHPTNWPETADEKPKAASANFGNIESQVRNGMKYAAEFSAENGRLLDEALALVQAALAETSGDASGSVHVEALRLKSAILFHKGMHERVAGRFKRNQADAQIDAVVLASQIVASETPLASIVKGSEIDKRLSDSRSAITTAETVVRDLGAELTKLDSWILEQESRLAALKSEIIAARSKVDGLAGQGVDLSRTGGVLEFERTYEAAMTELRSAMRNVEIVAHGDYVGAQIDASEDFLSGKYVARAGADSATALKRNLGLENRKKERALLARRMEVEESSIAELRKHSEALAANKSALELQESSANERVAVAISSATKGLEVLSAQSAEAGVLEEKALGFFEQSAAAARQAAIAADQWVADARDRSAGLSPESAERSADAARANGRWMVGHCLAQSADALMAKGSIWVDRYNSAQRVSSVLAGVPQLGSATAGPAATFTKNLVEAQTAGIAIVEQAVKQLEKAFRDAGGHWTIAAQCAAAMDQLSSLGFDGYDKDVVEAYRAALKGREDKPFAQRVASRLRRLELSEN